MDLDRQAIERGTSRSAVGAMTQTRSTLICARSPREIEELTRASPAAPSHARVDGGHPGPEHPRTPRRPRPPRSSITRWRARATCARPPTRDAERDPRASARAGARARRRGRAGRRRRCWSGRLDGRRGRRAGREPARGRGRLAGDLAAVERGMGELYDAASGRARGPATPAGAHRRAPRAAARAASGRPAPARAVGRPGRRWRRRSTAPAEAPDAPRRRPRRRTADRAEHGAQRRSRADTERYLAENFELADRQQLIDEVYAAIEGTEARPRTARGGRRAQANICSPA